jgi:hypothetical protein
MNISNLTMLLNNFKNLYYFLSIVLTSKVSSNVVYRYCVLRVEVYAWYMRLLASTNCWTSLICCLSISVKATSAGLYAVTARKYINSMLNDPNKLSCYLAFALQIVLGPSKQYTNLPRND